MANVVELKNVIIDTKGNHGIFEYEADFRSHIKKYQGPCFRQGGHPLNEGHGILITAPKMDGTFYGTIFIPKPLEVPFGGRREIEYNGVHGNYVVHAKFLFIYGDGFEMKAEIKRK